MTCVDGIIMVNSKKHLKLTQHVNKFRECFVAKLQRKIIAYFSSVGKNVDGGFQSLEMM